MLVVDRAIPHAAGKNEPPMGPTIAKGILVGLALRAGISAPCHSRMLSTGPCPSPHHAEYPRWPSASGIAAGFHTTARRTTPVTTPSASIEASRSGPSFVRHSVARGTSCALLPGRYVGSRRRSCTPASGSLPPRTLFPPLGGACLRLSSPHPPLPCWPFSTAGRVPATSCSSEPPRPSPTPRVPDACPRRSPSLADSSSLPLLQPVPLARPSTLHSLCAWRCTVSPTC